MSRKSSVHAPSHRIERVGELIRHALAEILTLGDVQDPVLERHPVTVPSVRMSPDLRLAAVMVMPLGGEAAAAILEALNRNRKTLRALVARRINLKFAPDLRFLLDPSFDAQARIEAILKSPEVARDLESSDREDDGQ
jgi:ribosome-binding factor A